MNNNIYCYLISGVFAILMMVFVATALSEGLLGNLFLAIVCIGVASIFGVAAADMFNKAREDNDLDDPQEPKDLI